jgi:hypothetical protein
MPEPGSHSWLPDLANTSAARLDDESIQQCARNRVLDMPYRSGRGLSMPRAGDQEEGTGHNPKGVGADDRNFNKDSNDRNNSDHESDEKSPVHLQPPRACSPVRANSGQFMAEAIPGPCRPTGAKIRALDPRSYGPREFCEIEGAIIPPPPSVRCGRNTGSHGRNIRPR